MVLRINNSYPINKITFKSNETENKNSTNADIEKTPNKKNDKLTLALTALGVLALGTIATVCAFKKGNTKGIKQGLEQGLTDGLKEGLTKGRAEGFAEGLVKGRYDNIKETGIIDLKTFKKYGKFNGGRAMLDSSTPYTGKIIANTDRSGNIIMEYQNGYLQKSFIQHSNLGNDVSVTKYYNSHDLHAIYSNGTKIRIDKNINGSITHNTILPVHNERTCHIKKDIKDGKINSLMFETFDLSHPNHRKGAPYRVKKVTDLNTGKVLSIKDMYKSPASKEYILYKKHVMKDGKKVTEIWNNDKKIGYISNDYNKDNGVLKKIYSSVTPEGEMGNTWKERQTYCENNNAFWLEKVFGEDGNLEQITLNSTKPINGEAITSFTVEDVQKAIEKFGLKFTL